MAKSDIFVFGASDHARVAIDIIQREGRYNIAGLFDSFKAPGSTACGIPVIGDEDDLAVYADRYGLTRGIVGIGDNATRQRIAQSIRERIPEVEWINAVHPSSSLSDSVNMQGGVMVMARCYVGLDTTIGEGAVIATNSIFEHDGVMGAYSTLGAGSTTGGHVTLGEATAICLGVTIIHGIKVGAHTVVGAGAIVIDDIPDYTVAYGNPARPIRSRRESSSYLHIRSESYVSS